MLPKKPFKKGSKLVCSTPELIENYDKAIADTTQTWHCHHRLETHNSDGERRLVDISKEELIALNMYYDRPVSELILLTPKEHASLHHKYKAKPHSDEHNKHLSESLKGKQAWNKGTNGIFHHSDETKKQISESHKGMNFSEEHRKHLSESRKGANTFKHWKLIDGKRVWY